ncbi:alkaline shock response membrane anchor protein AmaP [Lacticaseibacillus mingshuiensis]|uniref:alkaline shock response membrane anchor protein AmaP n=1 Tax=Lacticaseibacillus mingshuiensis TaxID=2799574 RepID=UPI00194ECEB2|nr:alkaline shock response membrane anchor protein AmaP [Lacticaseibacillus mingshuiensis]
MRPLTKVALVLVALLGICQTLLIAAYFWPVAAVDTWLLDHWSISRILMLTLTSLVFIVFVAMLLVALFRRSIHQELVMTGDRGSLAISRQAVESAVAKAVAKEHAVKGVSVDVTMHKKEAAKVMVEAISMSGQSLAAQGQRIEETARAKVVQLLGTEVKKVKVHLMPVSQAPRGTARVL